MAIRVDMTQRIIDSIARCCGEGSVDANEVVVYETICVNQKPLTKAGTLYENAVAAMSFLTGMVDFVNNGGAVPMHTLHNQRWELPVGKVFEASLVAGEVRALFYIPKIETDLISKLDTGVINEVSIGAIPEKCLCSKCGFDFFSEKATFSNLYTRTCDKDHEIGVDGTYVIMEGLRDWSELSLVSRGAASGAKILPKAKQVLSSDTYGTLAASGLHPEMTLLYASFNTDQGKDKMDLAALMADATQKGIDLGLAQKELKLTQEKLAKAEGDLVALKADFSPEKLAEKFVPVEEHKVVAEANAEAVKFLQAEFNRMAVLAGETATQETDVKKLTEGVESLRVKLSAKFPKMFTAEPTDAAGAQAAINFDAFKTVK